MASAASMTAHTMPPLGKIPPKSALQYTERFSEPSLRQWRRVADPLADDITTQLANECDLGNIHDMLGVVEERAATEGGVFQRFLDGVGMGAGGHLPDWVDFDKMERGQRIIQTYMLHMFLSLAHGSLVAVGGQFPKMVDVVRATGMLSADRRESQKRLDRTSRFVILLCTPGELAPGREGHKGILRVRLLHGAVRRYAVRSGAYTETDEVPVNQHDLAITLGLFGYVNLRSLRRLGIRFSRSDVDSFMHLWRFVGWSLGIQDELLPRSFADQQEFFLASTKMMGDDHATAGSEIAEVYQKAPQAISRNMKGVVPASVVEGAGFHLLNLFAGEEYLAGIQSAGGLKGRPAPWIIAIIQASGRLCTFVDNWVPFGGQALSSANMAFARRTLPSEEESPHKLRSNL
eukprot:TRINITY_DN71240_c0_g1_i1.p1 TRINITY_DN71240_c0_g1~~TRINITY_DN71240_c0_g1_i1.p1  ORF type:complete len:426 (+),score=54.63 TRINITY_DN71240_c0_g1_i1:67-1278(+)